MQLPRATLQSILEEMEWPQEAAVTLAECAHVIEYTRGAPIFHTGEPADLVYFLLEGEAKLYYVSPCGERLLVTIVRDSERLGVVDLSDVGETRATQLLTAEAFSKCKVAVLTRARLRSAALDLPADTIFRILEHGNEPWTRLCTRFCAFMTMDVRNRLVYAIREIASSFGIRDARGELIALRLSHEDFGELVGASRPMVSKHLKDLANAGIFFKENGRYILSSKARSSELWKAALEAEDWPLCPKIGELSRRREERRAARGHGLRIAAASGA